MNPNQPLEESKLSLWLCPSDTTNYRLKKTISDIALQLQSSSFEPHITLCSPITDFDKKVESTLKFLGLTFSAVEIFPEEFSYKQEFFRCLYIAVQNSGELLRLHSQINKSIHNTESQQFEPHISLAYKEPKSFKALDIIQTLNHSLLMPMTFNRLTLVETSGEISQWQTVMEIKLDA